MLVLGVLEFIALPVVILALSYVVKWVSKLNRARLKHKIKKAKAQRKDLKQTRKDLQADLKNVDGKKKEDQQAKIHNVFAKETAITIKIFVDRVGVQVSTFIVWLMRILASAMLALGSGILIASVGAFGAIIVAAVIATSSATASQDTNTDAKTEQTAKTGYGDSESAGQGAFTQEAEAWAKTWEMTYIGDSLGVGVTTYGGLNTYFPKATFDVDTSRGIQIKGISTGETATATLKRLISENKLGDNLVLALGTNPHTEAQAKEFYALIPDSVKTVTWVYTASGIPNKDEVNASIKSVIEADSKHTARYLNWDKYITNNGGYSSIASSDGIHMTNEGYQTYAKFQTQGLYDLWGGGSSDNSGEPSSGTKSSYPATVAGAKQAFEDYTAELGISGSDKENWAKIIELESGWNPTIYSGSGSGAYGLPQSLPASKMASAGSDWETNPLTQLKWMKSYMDERYGGISQAMAYWNAHGNY